MKHWLCLFSTILSSLVFSQNLGHMESLRVHEEKLRTIRSIVTNRFGEIEHTKWKEKGFSKAVEIYMEKMEFSEVEKIERLSEVRILFLEAFYFEEIKILNWEQNESINPKLDLAEQERLSAEYESRRNENALKNSLLSSTVMENDKMSVKNPLYLKQEQAFMKRTFFTESGELNSEYLGKEGYIRFSKEFHLGNMSKSYRRIKQLFKTEYIDFSALGWGSIFEGNVNHYVIMRDFLLQGQQTIDTLEWFGTTDGLNRAAKLFLENAGTNQPFDLILFEKVKRNFIAVVTEGELLRLSWSHKVSPEFFEERLRGLGGKRFQKLNELRFKAAQQDTISVSKSVKKSTRK